jgi:hypothetical protein
VSDRPAGRGRIPAVHIFRRLWSFIKDQLVQDVPVEVEPCEFHCRVGQCTMGEWEACENRLRTLAEKMSPAEPPKSPIAD